MQDEIQRLREAVKRLAPSCQAIIGAEGDAHWCGEPADWHAEWSDRELCVCETHKNYAQENHDGDHDYDQTGIIWTKLETGRIAREALGLSSS